MTGDEKWPGQFGHLGRCAGAVALEPVGGYADLLGGVLTEYINWRWCMYVNIVFAVVAAVGATVYVITRGEQRNRDRLDVELN